MVQCKSKYFFVVDEQAPSELVKVHQVSCLRIATVITYWILGVSLVTIGILILTTGIVPTSILSNTPEQSEIIEVKIEELAKLSDELNQPKLSDQLDVVDIRKVLPGRSKRDISYYSYPQPQSNNPFTAWYDGNSNLCNPAFWAGEQNELSMRQRRDLNYSPNYYNELYNVGKQSRHYPPGNWKKRSRRRAELENGIKFWNSEYIRCKKSAPDSPDCDALQDNILSLVNELEQRLEKMRNFVSHNEMSTSINSDGFQPKYQMYPDNIQGLQSQLYGFDDSNIIPESSPIHEDLNVASPWNFGQRDNFNVEHALRQKNDHVQFNSQIGKSKQFEENQNMNTMHNDNVMPARNENPLGMRCFSFNYYI